MTEYIVALVVIATCGLVAWGRKQTGQALSCLAALLLLLSPTMPGLLSLVVLLLGIGTAVWSLLQDRSEGNT
jgi:hypothetical protein